MGPAISRVCGAEECGERKNGALGDGEVPPPPKPPLAGGLPAYARRCRAIAAAAASGGAPVTVVLGNEAADLDSMACALVVAYHAAVRANDGDADSWGARVLPVLNAPRAELALRRDNLEALGAAGVRADDLVCADELDLAGLAVARKLALVLVDHNALSPRQDALAGAVAQIVDHHRDERLYRAAEREVVVPCGSCATLVAAQLAADGARGARLLAEKAVHALLRSAIAIDTDELRDAHKTTPRDEAALAALDAAAADAPRGGAVPLGEAWTARLRRARADVSGFSTAQILRKDLKYARARGGGAAASRAVFSVASVKLALAERGVLADEPSLRAFLGELAAAADAERLAAAFALCAGGARGRKHLVAGARVADDGGARWRAWRAALGARLRAGDASYGGVAVRGDEVAWPLADGAAVLGWLEGGDGATCGAYAFALFDLDGAASRKQVLPFLQDVLGPPPDDGAAAALASAASSLRSIFGQ